MLPCVLQKLIVRRGTVTETEPCRDHYAVLGVVQIMVRRGTVTETEPCRDHYAALGVLEIIVRRGTLTETEAWCGRKVVAVAVVLGEGEKSQPYVTNWSL